MQFYYGLKADYVHFSYFYDIDRVLIGEESYKWKSGDLGQHDDRMNEIDHVSGGFDYGSYAIGFTLSSVQYAIRHEDSFFTHRVQMPTWDLAFQDRRILARFFVGNANDIKEEEGGRRMRNNEDEPEAIREAREKLAKIEALKPAYKARMRFYRFNLSMNSLPLQPLFSMIYRSLRFYIEEDQNGLGELTYSSTAVTASMYVKYSFDEDLDLSGYLSLENHRAKSGISYFEENTNKNYPKAGINISLAF
ncbi:MAG: hypothetical protein HQK54_18500 [Oligoflexales bacterium]|nr:hypothetical protein [Oligoflexales bacterium]